MIRISDFAMIMWIAARFVRLKIAPGPRKSFKTHTMTTSKIPDLIVAFNSGMFEECTESWKSSLQVMLDMNIPCLFTSYAKNEAVGDYAILKSLNANCLTDEALLNPMRDCAPYIEPCPSMSTFQVNRYCIGFKGRAACLA
jgi:hypothetical protein